MLEPSEVVEDEAGGLSATLPAIDARTAHVRGVLKVEDGESLRVGVVNGESRRLSHSFLSPPR